MSMRDLLVKHHKFDRPRSVRQYGFRGDRLIEQPGSIYGFLLSWDAIDDEARSHVENRPPMYVVVGETVNDGIRYPDLAVSDAYMKYLGYRRDGRSWTRDAA